MRKFVTLQYQLLLVLPSSDCSLLWWHVVVSPNMPGVQVLPLTVRFKPTWMHMLSHPDLLTSMDLKSVDFRLAPNPSQERGWCCHFPTRGEIRHLNVCLTADLRWNSHVYVSRLILHLAGSEYSSLPEHCLPLFVILSFDGSIFHSSARSWNTAAQCGVE